MTETCVRGCTIRGQHVPPCTCTLECPPHENHCTGCALAPAVDGLLCRRDGSRARDNLGEREGLPGRNGTLHGLAWAWEHLAVAYPWMNSAGGDGRGTSVADREIQRWAAVVSMRDEIRDWMSTVTADLSERINLPGPKDIRISTDWQVPPRAADPRGDFVIVRRCSEYLLRHIDPLLTGAGWPDPWTAGESVRTVYEESCDLMVRAHALAPWRPERTVLDGVPCPQCEHVGRLHIDGGESTIDCAHCGLEIEERAYRRWTQFLADTARDDVKAGRLAERRNEGAWRRTHTLGGGNDAQVFGRLEFIRQRYDAEGLHGWIYPCPGRCGADWWVPDGADLTQTVAEVAAHVRQLHPELTRQVRAG